MAAGFIMVRRLARVDGVPSGFYWKVGYIHVAFIWPLCTLVSMHIDIKKESILFNNMVGRVPTRETDQLSISYYFLDASTTCFILKL